MYDGDGTMVKSIINGISTYYAGRHYNIMVNGEDTNIQKTYAFGSISVAVRNDGVLNWLLSDHLGSTSITANADGSLKSEIRYSAFGEVRYSSGNTATNYQFTNQLNQPDIGMYFYVARFYDPVIAHFVQTDTIVPGAGNPAAYDRYAYVLYNPIRLNDPSGHATCDEDGNCYMRIGERLPNKSKQLPVVTPIYYQSSLRAINFSSDGTKGWSSEEIKVVNSQANQLARTMAMTINQERGTSITPQGAWNRAFGEEPINFIRSGNSHSSGAIGWTVGLTVTVYQCKGCNSSSISYILSAKGRENIITHELAHVMINATGYTLNIDDDLIRPMENGDINHGTSANGFYGYAGAYQQWQFGFGGTQQDEEFADMLIGWSFSSWNREAGKEMGEQRANDIQKIMIDLLSP